MPTATKKCVCCKERKRNEEMMQTPNKQWFCGHECIASYANKKWQKVKRINNYHENVAKNKKDKALKKSQTEKKKALKKRTGKNGYYDNLKTALHRYIKHVLRKGEPCYT